MLNLSPKQKLILNFLKSESSKKGYIPSVQEICEHVGLKSTSTVHSHLNKLEQLGYIITTRKTGGLLYAYKALFLAVLLAH